MSSAKTLTTGLLLGCLGVGAYAALENESPAQARGSAEKHPESPAHPGSPEKATPHDEGEEIEGDVVEVIQVSAYTYLRLERENEDELWVAVSKADVNKGQHVQVTRAERMENFSSKQLSRTFPVIYFGMLGKEESNPHAEPPFERSDRSSLADMVKIVPGDKAEGDSGYLVSDLFTQKEKLQAAKIRVRGTVVQVTMNVMGTNFVHIRDGSGDAESKTHDLVLKVAEMPPKVGESAVFEGILRTGVDLGAGYTYSVLVEDAFVVGK